MDVTNPAGTERALGVLQAPGDLVRRFYLEVFDVDQPQANADAGVTVVANVPVPVRVARSTGAM